MAGMGKIWIWALTLCVAPLCHAQAPITQDPHYSAAGFFDIHLCDWPDRPNFIKVLFSTERYAEVAEMVARYPDGRELVRLDLSIYRLVERKGKPEKRVFIKDLDIPEDSPEGWYSMDVTLKDGSRYQLRDYMTMARIRPASGMNPPNNANNIPMPHTLSWQPVPGARYYQVFLRDNWASKQVISSELLKEPRLELKPGQLEPGGDYVWRVHARDTDGHFMLGDFHAGSMSKSAAFTVAD